MSHKSKHGKNHPTANAKESSTQKESTNRHVYIEPGVQIDVVQDLKDQYQTERAEDKASHKKQLFWTRIAAGLVLVYTVIMGWQLKVARDTFKAANRPYIGVHAIDVSYWDTAKKFYPAATSETVGMAYDIEVKNFGPVPASKYVAHQRVTLAGIELPTTKEGKDYPFTVFPSEALHVQGSFREYYTAIQTEGKILIVEIAMQYDGPAEHYHYCERFQYSPRVSHFFKLGTCERQ